MGSFAEELPPDPRPDAAAEDEADDGAIIDAASLSVSTSGGIVPTVVGRVVTMETNSSAKSVWKLLLVNYVMQICMPNESICVLTTLTRYYV